MQLATRFVQLFAIFSFCISFVTYSQELPKLTVIFVVDQLAYHYLSNLKPHFIYGFKEFLDKGINFINAYMPHGSPSTGTGHAGLNTGTYAKDHGIIANRWFGKNGEKIYCDDDERLSAKVFGNNIKGKSAHNVMVDGISDQFMLGSCSNEQHYVYAISYKSRSAILMANKLGKAIWFDRYNGNFTSSTAYFPTLPKWVEAFNTKRIQPLTSVYWKPAFSDTSDVYQLVDNNTYKFIRNKKGLINKKILFKDEKQKDDDYFETFMQTPQSNQLLLDLGKTCVNQYLAQDTSDRMILWLSLTSLDKIGHHYGPDSKEVIDMIYHLDKQIGAFMRAMQEKFAKERVLFVLTADHGIGQLPEVMQLKGYAQAGRIFPKELIKQMNVLILKQYGIANIIKDFKTPQFYVDRNQLYALAKKTQINIIKDLQKFLLKQPGIRRVWTYKQLAHSCFEPSSIENFFKQQLYPTRSGLLTIQVEPYITISKHTHGVWHRSPYEYDTHVPLILYQPDALEDKTILQKVWTLQFPNTLARILHVATPSASTFDVLPDVFE